MADGLLSMQRRKDDKQLAAEIEEKTKRRKHAMKRRFKFDTQLYLYKASKVSYLFDAYIWIWMKE